MCCLVTFFKYLFALLFKYVKNVSSLFNQEIQRMYLLFFVVMTYGVRCLLATNANLRSTVTQ